MSFHIKPGYVEREKPAYYLDDGSYGFTAQPDVYPYAAGLACSLGLRSLVDVGCGQAHKLRALHAQHPNWRLVGVDHGDNIRWCREHLRWGYWFDLNLEDEHTIDAEDSVLVCADVIEHLKDPRPLIRTIKRSGCARALISTPDRDLTWGKDHMGPPPNDCHVREWNRAELRAFLEAEGCRVESLSLTASDDNGSGYLTSLAVIA